MVKTQEKTSKPKSIRKSKKYSVCPNCRKLAVLKNTCRRCGAKNVGPDKKELPEHSDSTDTPAK